MDNIILSCCFILALSCANGSEANEELSFYELKRGDFSVKISNWGATVVSVVVPDREGKLGDVVLGYESLQEYTNDTTYFGAIVGRVANRIGGAAFTLYGTKYKLVANEGINMLHGGPKGYSDVIWTVRRFVKGSHITLGYNSFDGEQGFPGDVSVLITYMLIGANKLAVKMEAKPLTKATPINLALHTYWNLGGHNSGDILSHNLQLFGSKVTPVDDQLIPTGEITSVKGTPYDFLQPHPIGKMIKDLPNGYDINYVLDNPASTSKHFKIAAIVRDDKSGRKMELWTNAVGVQLYTGNMLGHIKGKDGSMYTSHAALCLETQGFPDSVNHPNFPSQIVHPGETYKHFMVFRFTAA